MITWEYDKFDLNNVPRKTEDIDLLDDAGKGGWELVHIASNGIAYLKRRTMEEVAAKAVTRKQVRRTAAPASAK
jgi:hypothetical protein